MSERQRSKQEIFAEVSVPEELGAAPGEALKPCVLCGSRQAKRLYPQAHFPVVRCSGCSLVYADEHFRWDDLQEFYSGDYYERAYVCHPAEIDSKIADGYVKAFDRVDRSLGGGEVLDFGCARGTFLAELRKRRYEARWKLRGVDVNPDEVRMGASEGLPLDHAFLHEAGYEDGRFDAVTSFSVVEHLQDPVEVLRQVARVTRPGGELLLIVPSGRCLVLDVAVWAHRILGDRVRGFSDNVFHEEHLYYFTERTMRHALDLAGYEVKGFFHQPSYLETHPPSALVAVGAYGLRFASWASRKMTMLGVHAVKRSS